MDPVSVLAAGNTRRADSTRKGSVGDPPQGRHLASRKHKFATGEAIGCNRRGGLGSGFGGLEIQGSGLSELFRVQGSGNCSGFRVHGRKTKSK